MAQYNPPSQNLPIFDSGLFGGTNSTSGGVPSGDFLNFPNAQGDENLLGITVADSATFNADSTFNDVVEINDDTTFSTNIIMSGTYLTNYIEFPDGTQQFSASGGTGDALLAGGTSSTPQTFTGYNEFDNANGRITLGNTTNTTKIKLESDSLQNDQLNINGQVSIGNPTNGNTVILYSDSTQNDQLDVDGNVSIGSSYQLSTPQIYFPSNPSTEPNNTTIGQDVNGITINNELTFISYSTPANSVIMYADAAVNNQLDVIGILDASTVQCGTVNINNIDTSVLLTCTGNTSTNQVLNVGGNLLTTGNMTLGSGSTTGASLTFGDGSVQTVAYTGQVPSGAASLTAGTSSSPQTFTGSNKINLLEYNGMSCPQKVVSNSVASSSTGSVWTFNVGTLTTSFGKSMSFLISSNNNNSSQPLATGAYVTDSMAILIGTGYGVNQPFTISGESGSFSAYVIYMTNFTNVSSWYFLTEVASGGAIYNCYVNDSNYYANNNIQLTMYISPTAVI